MNAPHAGVASLLVRLASLRDRRVRALAWLIGSEPLFAASARVISADTHTADFDHAWDWLCALDADPTPLAEWLATRETRRLGRYAEALLHFWLAHDPRFTLHAAGVQVRDGGVTLGDFDFLLTREGETHATHWELAVKFYLHTGDTDAGFAGYVGPGRADVLARKWAHINERQLRLSETVAAQTQLATMGLHSALHPQAFVKGCLYYPWAAAPFSAPALNPQHARGWWLRADDSAIAKAAQGCVVKPLARHDWIVWPHTAHAEDALPEGILTGLQSVAAQVEAEQSPVMVALLRREEGRFIEVSRGFVVPRLWGMADTGASP